MVWVNSQNTGFLDIRSVGPVAQAIPVIDPLPTTIAAGGQWQSAILPADGFKALAVGVTSSQAGDLSVQRFIDTAGAVLQGTSTTQPLTAGAAGTVSIADGAPFASFQITITNTGSLAATVTNFATLLNAA